VLDGEVMASDADGLPNFARLHVRWTRPGTIHLWAFDLLGLNEQDWRPQPLVKRQARLQALLERARRSDDPRPSWTAWRCCVRPRTKVVSKRRDAPYRSGECRDWRKVKTEAWREANRERWRLFA
jgi:bifunctional non-homologous end joining protein LigD